MPLVAEVSSAEKEEKEGSFPSPPPSLHSALRMYSRNTVCNSWFTAPHPPLHTSPKIRRFESQDQERCSWLKLCLDQKLVETVLINPKCLGETRLFGLVEKPFSLSSTSSTPIFVFSKNSVYYYRGGEPHKAIGFFALNSATKQRPPERTGTGDYPTSIPTMEN